jgi:hypothetical protein
MGQTFIDMGKCYCIFTNELPPILNAEVSTKIEKKPKLRFTSLLIRNHSMSFSDFTKHHREKHIQLRLFQNFSFGTATLKSVVSQG